MKGSRETFLQSGNKLVNDLYDLQPDLVLFIKPSIDSNKRPRREMAKGGSQAHQPANRRKDQAAFLSNDKAADPNLASLFASSVSSELKTLERRSQLSPNSHVLIRLR